MRKSYQVYVNDFKVGDFETEEFQNMDDVDAAKQQAAAEFNVPYMSQKTIYFTD